MLTSGTATLNLPDGNPPSEGSVTLPHTQPDPDSPVFSEPWQAEAFALAVRLSAQGHFTWIEWAAALAEELRLDAARGEPGDGSRYYHCWLLALEHLVISKHLSDRAALSARKAEWAEAYAHTPHGEPVELGNGSIPQ